MTLWMQTTEIVYIFYCRAVGGREAEMAERQKWINKERQRIDDSVNCK